MKVSIIIPAHNEELRIARTLDLYSTYFENLRKEKKLEYEIMVVVNASTDSTLDLVKKASKKNKKIKYMDLERGGKGYAVIEGFKDALKSKSDLIGFVDGDASTLPQYFYDLIKAIHNHDGVIASRYVPGAKVDPKPSFQRVISSRLYNIFIRTLFLMPYRDTQCGAKLFRRQALVKTIGLFKMSQWAFDVDILYHLNKKGYSIAEIPTVWSDRLYSKINFIKAGPYMALGVLRLRILNSPFKRIIKLYDQFIGFVKKT